MEKIADQLADTMNGLRIDGVVYRPVYLIPTFSMNVNERCKGVQKPFSRREMDFIC